MNTKTKREAIVDFDFQFIPLQRADELVPTAYKSIYEDLRKTLKDTIQKVPPGHAFAFGKKNYKFEASVINGIQTALNTMLKKENSNWRVYWSNEHKLFVCKPIQPRMRKKPPIAIPRDTEFFIQAASKTFNLSVEDITGPTRSALLLMVRRAIVYCAVTHEKVPIRLLAEALHRDHSSVNKMLRNTMPDDHQVKQLEAVINN